MKTMHRSPSIFRHGRNFHVFNDPIHDPYHMREKLSEPTVCADCGAVYHSGHWQWTTTVPSHAHQTRCSACHRIHEQLPAGYVLIEGQFADDHREELLSLIRHREAREKAEHPMQRIMSLENLKEKLLITTTDIHLARDIGEALKRAYKGTLEFHYNHAQYLLRVSWKR